MAFIASPPRLVWGKNRVHSELERQWSHKRAPLTLMLVSSAFENRLEGLQQTESLAVEVEHGAGADRDAALIGEVVANAVVWHELLLGHVDRLSLHRVSVLNRPGYPSWKLRDELMALSVLHYLGSVFGHHFRDFDIDDLPGLKTHASILAARDGAPVDFDGFDPIWILFPLESRPVVPILAARLTLLPLRLSF